MATVTLGKTTTTLNTNTPTSGTVYSKSYTVTTAFQATNFYSPLTAANMPPNVSAGWQSQTSTGGTWTTRYTIVAGEDADHADFSPVTLNVGNNVRFFINNTSGVAQGYKSSNVSGSTFPLEMRAYINGPGEHTPTIDIISPSGNIGTNLRPSISWEFNDDHSVDAASFSILQGSTVLRSVMRSNAENSVHDGTYTYDFLFGTDADDLPRGGSFTMRIYARCLYGASKTVSVPFTTAPSATSLTINAPSSGQVDRTPNFQAVGTNNYAETIEETEWTVSSGSKTTPGINSGMGASYLEHAPGADWLTYVSLNYGSTYTVNLRVKTSDGLWTGSASKVFSIAAYEPTATLTAPIVKQDTLTPTITGAFTSSQGFSKEAHEFLIMTPSRVIVGRKTEISNSTTPFSTVYTNDGSWQIYTPLQWGTSYIFAVRVQDSDDVWSTTSAGKASERTIRTNTAPSPPTGLSPATGSNVNTRQPQLYANFNDVDTSDLPSLMEVQLAGVTNTAFGFNRVESDGDEVFSTLLSDGFVIGDTYSWRVRFTDNGGLQGAWSSWATFTVREGVETNFTTPVDDEVLTTPVQTFAWSYTHPSGVPQSSGRLRIYPQTGAVPIYDSGVVLGSYLEQELSTTLFQNNQIYRAQVQVTDNNGDTAASPIIYFQTNWVGPDQPESLFATPFDNEGMVRIDWQISTIENFVGYRVYRRDPSELNAQFVLIEEIRNRLGSSIDYYFAPSGKPYEYTVTIVENSTGAEIESNITDYISATVNFPYVTWLNEQYDPAVYQVKLQFNPSRAETYSRVSTTLHPIGRRFPVVHYGKAFTHTLQTTFMIYMPYTERTVLDGIIERGLPVLYRDGRGRKIWVAVAGYTITDTTASRGNLQLDLQRISVVDK